jgi:hypothetical protein
MQTVRENYEGFTKKDVIKAKEDRQAQGLIGNPSKKDFKGMVSNHLIPNCPVTYAAITNARKIFGPDLASIRGKTVQWVPEPVMADYVAVPHPVIEQNIIVTMAVDVFFVDGTAFLITMSRRIKFVTAEHMPARTGASLSKRFNKVIQVYWWAGFLVRTVLMDGEFENIKDLMPRLECNTTAAKEHVSKAEHMIWTIKERTRGLIGTLPINNIP